MWSKYKSINLHLLHKKNAQINYGTKGPLCPFLLGEISPGWCPNVLTALLFPKARHDHFITSLISLDLFLQGLWNKQVRVFLQFLFVKVIEIWLKNGLNWLKNLKNRKNVTIVTTIKTSLSLYNKDTGYLSFNLNIVK